MSFSAWTPNDDPAVVVDTSQPQGWDALRQMFTPHNLSQPFERLVAIAQLHDVRSVVIERRYIDFDYRSEHARFYSGTFRRYPSVSHRLHFFAETVTPALDNIAALAPSYCGYSVMRPLPNAPVGRTMIKPPPDLLVDDAMRCESIDEVHLFGWPLTIAAMPFMSQEAQYMRCAHAVQWMVLHHAHLTHRLPRRVPADIHEASLGGVVVGRQLPSEGLSLNQMLLGLGNLQLSPAVVALPTTRQASAENDELSLFALLCRYINSQVPPIVVSNQHAWVVVGYIRDPGRPRHESITLYRHDDAAGPYIRVEDPWAEPSRTHVPWSAAILPLPQKVYLSAQRAEAIGRYWLLVLAREYGRTDVLRLNESDGLAFRTYAVPAHLFKARTCGRLPGDVEHLYRLAHWPRYVWVVEAVDRERRRKGQPAVWGEAVLDTTAHQLSTEDDPMHLSVLALHIDGMAISIAPDFETTHVVDLDSFTPYASGAGPWYTGDRG